MASPDLPSGLDAAALSAENRLLREEIRVSREAAEITATLVVEQFEKTEATLARLEQAKEVAEAALRENKGIFDNAPFGIAFTNDRKIIRYNRAFGDMFLFRDDAGLGQPGRVLYASDESYAEVGRLAGPLLARNLPFEHEMLLQRQNGDKFWANVKAYVADPRDLSIGTVWLVQDRTAFKSIEAEIEQSAEEMTAIFEASTFGIAFIKDRLMVKANRKLEELFGYAPGELKGKGTRCWYADEESYAGVGASYRELEEGKTHRRVLPMRRKDGTLFWARLSGVALSADAARGSVWTVEDITIEYEATAALREAKEQAEAAEARLRESYGELEEANRRLRQLDQLKSDFLSSVSHELRTPLTSIRGFASLIDREFVRSFAPQAEDNPVLQKKSSRIQDNLKIILKESERLTRLINDVLDLAKIESGRTEWRDTVLPVADFVRDAANATAGMFEHKSSVALRLEIAPDLPPFVGDADRMQQVLVNLLNNAAKFTDHGSVTVQAWLSEAQRIRIDVRDTGIGFPPEDAESIFDKFQQAKQGDTLMDRPKGTGLGLAICREIVNRHGGRIWADSAPGAGSVFSIELPPAASAQVAAAQACADAAARADTVAAGAAESGAGARMSLTRVLVVDDDQAVRDYFTQLLQEQGYEVVTAADGEAALAAARLHQPDLITMDLAMPVMDGRTAIGRLRADPELRRIPIMVISAIPGWETAGGDVAMSKPLDERCFVENIHVLLRDGRADAGGREVDFLVLYADGQAKSAVPESFSAYCRVSFCPVGDLISRVQAGFEGMVAIPVDLLNKVDIDFLNATPALKVMIMPVAAAGADGMASARTAADQQTTIQGRQS